MSQFMRAFTGLLIGVIVDILVNLVAAGIQQHSFPNQLISVQGIVILAILAVLGLLIGYFLDKPSQVSASTSSQPTSPQNVKITLSRFRTFWSASKFKGPGIQANDITTFGSTIDIDTADK